jgi:transcriptional regulator with AAA-type ATPase domain
MPEISAETHGETYEENGSSGAAPIMAARPHLFLVLESDRPTAGGARFALSGVDEVVLGRGSERVARTERAGGKTRLVVRVPGGWMSGTHARLVSVRGSWVLEDGGSRNGTWLDGVRVDRKTLGDGDVFEAGRTLFRFREGIPTPPGSAGVVDGQDLRAYAPGLRTLIPELAARHAELERVATSNVPLVLLGETGTGKEVLARAAHQASKRPGVFVAVNCGGLSPALVEGLLFGHVKGAFSGALRDEPGFVRAADHGTLFLDEIGDFPEAAQAALLRVLQEREVVPVGTSRPIAVDFRVIAATHRDLDELVARGSFRRDLLMRMDGFRHALAPLRDRPEDLGVLLADILARRHGGRGSLTLTSAASRALLAYDWPGNVRELEQVLGRALAVAGDGPIDAPHLGRTSLPKTTRAQDEALEPEDAKLRDELTAALARHAGNISEVARTMGKARMQIQRWIRRFELDPESYRRSK